MAASSSIPQFISHSLEGENKDNDPYKSYSHYCVPIICSGRAQGVMDIFLSSDHQRDKREEEFLAAAANTLAGVIKRKKSEEQVSKINEGFISLGVEPLENIQRLVILCGDILGAGFAIYNRFDYAQDAFYCAGQYNASPGDLEALKPYEKICQDIIKKNYENIFVLDDLGSNQEVNSSAANANTAFRACMGQAVKCRGRPVGVISVFYRNDFIPGDEAKKFLGIIVSAIGIEEERINANLQLKDAYDKLKKAQFGLVQSEKMAALGRFSSGIAHEVKNPLGIILGGIEFLERKLAKSDKDVQMATRKIKEATLRADHIIRNLLKFAMPSEIRTEVINPKDLLNDTLSFFKYRASLVNVDIITEFSKEDILVKADKNQIQQVLFNLLMNASEAITEAGQITIKLYKVDSMESDSEKQGCVIEIIDTGEGIKKEYLSKLFEPFFTTKRDKKGTGLGLSISKMIIENHKGNLTIDGEPGKGTCVKVTLPVAKKE
ncbi:MAG: GHKL domain-containing protein, partial [Candidatus Omnitrophica bacterium]|nr:GHKL domain-containing protein [Candidatus Omnitrophota bacterium]